MTQANPIPIDVKNWSFPALICPVCGDAYIHPVGLECRSPGRREGLLRVDARGIFIDPEVGAVGRGVQITLRFWCEQGHRFDYVLSFHKGQTFVEPLIASKEFLTHDRPATIWRD